jgi:hypothetical protein
MAYTLATPYQWQTWGAGYWRVYSRTPALQVVASTVELLTVPIPPSLTDVARGQTIIVNGTNVTLTLTPSQDELAAASYYFLGGHEYEISDYQAQVLINAGLGDYVTPV